MRSLYLVALAFLTAAAAPAAQTGPEKSLTAELQQALDAPGWTDDQWSVLVVSLDGGDTLFAHQPDTPLTPASNLKLFTTAAALRHLGPDYRYSTYLVGTGPLRNGVLEGDLVVYGTGDPTLSARFFETKTAVWEAVADSLATVGVRRITGDLVGDASYFEDSGVGRGWQTSYVTHTYAARASALSFNDNIVTMRVTPGPSAGAPAEIQLIPGGSVELRNEATTGASGRARIRIERDGYDSPIVVTGEIRPGDSGQWRAVPVVDPARFTASVVREILIQRGIQVDGGVRATHDPRASVISGQQVFAPATDEDDVIQVLALHRSPPLLEILKVINQRSHNLYAEAVLRTVGRVAAGRGSVEGGAATVRAMLDEAGIGGATVEIDDGSGLSTLDRASARDIVGLLAYMAESPHADAYFETLPEAATSRGLRRMQTTAAAGNLRAKTGTIDRVSALSGYVRSSTGERLAFSILANNVPSTWTAKRVEDRIGARLASFDRPAPTRRVASARPGAPADEHASDRAGTADARATAGAADSVASRRGERRVAASDNGESRPSPPAAPTAADSASAREETPAAEEAYYTIQSGDTLEGIAKRHGTTVAALRSANPGVRDRRLMPGQRLKLPGS